MSVAFRSATSGSVTASGSSVTISKPAGTVDGDFLVAFQSQGSSGAQANLTGPASWTLEGSGGVDGNSGVVQVWTRIASSEPASWVWGKLAAAGNMCVSVLCFSSPAATPEDGTTVYDDSTTSNTTPTSSGITTTFDSDIICLCIMANASGPTISTPTGMTQRTNPIAGTSNTHATFTQVITPPATTGTISATFSVAQKWVTSLVPISNQIIVAALPSHLAYSRAALVNASTI